MNAFVKTTLITVGILSFTLALEPVSANIYKHVDEYGNVSYSDKPIQGAEKIKVRGSKSQSDTDSNADSTEEPSGEDKEPAESPDYKSLQILTPRQGKVIDSDASAVQVILLPTPSLGKEDALVINIDGQDISKGRDVNLSVKNLQNGEHTVTSRIENSAGKVIIESASVNFKIGE